MTARFRLAIVALCVGFLPAACASVSGGTAFQPPQGWSGTPAMFGRLQMWMKPGSKSNDVPQMLMLMKTSASNTRAKFDEVPQYNKDFKVLQRGSTTLCGTQSAEQFVAEGADRNGRKARIEMITTVIQNERYTAMYLRPIALAADAQAESAIHSLCPAK